MHDAPAERDFEEVFHRPRHSEYKASPELMTRFLEQAEILPCPRQHTLFRIGEAAQGVYLVLNGEVELLLPFSDHSAMRFRADCGSLLGLPAAYTGEPYSMTAVALTELKLAVMSTEEFCRMVESDSALSLEVLRILAGETRAIRAAILSLARDDGSPTLLN